MKNLHQHLTESIDENLRQCILAAEVLSQYREKMDEKMIAAHLKKNKEAIMGKIETLLGSQNQ